MDEKKNKHVTIIESSDNNVNNNNNGSRTSMDILADLATALVDKEMESLLPNSLVKLLDDTKLTTASDYYERAIKTMKQKSESTNDSSSSSSSSLDRKAIALSSVVFTVGRPFSPNGFLLSQLADHARVSLEALLYPLLSYIELLDMTKEYEETVKATNDRFVMCSLLHERYTRIICRTEDISKESTLGPSLQNDKKGLYRVLMIRLGWLLFVLLKDSDMFSEDELRDKLYHILLCCVNFVSMNSPLGMFATESENNNGGVKSYYSFEALCAQDSMPYAETLDVQDTVFRTFVKRLCGDGLLAVKSLGNTRSAAQRDFIPLEVLRTALTNLDNTYSEKLSFSGEFDERYFQRDLSMFSAAQQQPQPMSSAVATTPIRSSVASNSPTHPLFTGDLRARHAPLPTPVAKSTPSRMGATSSSLFLSGTPAPPPPPTPVRTKVSMLKWLDGLMRVQPGPGPVLSRLLRDNGAEEQAAALNAKVEELTVGLGLPGIQRTVLRQKQQQQQQQQRQSNLLYEDTFSQQNIIQQKRQVLPQKSFSTKHSSIRRKPSPYLLTPGKRSPPPKSSLFGMSSSPSLQGPLPQSSQSGLFYRPQTNMFQPSSQRDYFSSASPSFERPSMNLYNQQQSNNLFSPQLSTQNTFFERQPMVSYQQGPFGKPSSQPPPQQLPQNNFFNNVPQPSQSTLFGRQSTFQYQQQQQQTNTIFGSIPQRSSHNSFFVNTSIQPQQPQQPPLPQNSLFNNVPQPPQSSLFGRPSTIQYQQHQQSNASFGPMPQHSFFGNSPMN